LYKDSPLAKDSLLYKDSSLAKDSLLYKDSSLAKDNPKLKIAFCIKIAL